MNASKIQISAIASITETTPKEAVLIYNNADYLISKRNDRAVLTAFAQENGIKMVAFKKFLLKICVNYASL